jgi:hypothetical protein
MGKPMSNAKSVRMPMLPELSDDNKRSLLLPQVQANKPLNAGQVNTNSGQQAPTAPAAPQQRRHDDPPRANYYEQETFSGTLNAMALKSTTRRKPTWEPLLSL